MKGPVMNNRTLLALLISIFALNTSVNAQYFGAEDLDILYETDADKEVLTYGKNTKIGFELVNKDKSPLWVTVINGNNTILDKKLVGRGSAFNENDALQAEIDIKKPTTVAIWYEEPKAVTISRSWFGAPTITPKPDITYSPATGTTIYIVHQNKTLSAQQPAIEGGVSKTDSNLNLNNNVSNNNLVLIKK